MIASYLTALLFAIFPLFFIENPKSATRTDMSTGEHQSEVSAMTKTKSENLLTEKKQKEVHRQTRSLGNFNQAKGMFVIS